MMSATYLFRNEQREAYETHGKHGTSPSKMFAEQHTHMFVQTGDKRTFWTKNFKFNNDEQITAECRVIGQHCIIYTDVAIDISDHTIDRIKTEFDNNIFMTATSAFGTIPDPGIDNEHRVTILIYDIQDYYSGSGIYYGGYFSHKNEYSKNEFATSNECEMLYVDYYPTLTHNGLNDFLGIVAHEFQHLIHWNHDPLEQVWFDEGCANYSLFLCGYGHPEEHVKHYFKTPETSLTTWDETLEDYGVSYLFISYLADRFGRQIIKELVADTLRGTGSVNYILKKYDSSFNDIYSDFVVTNYANDPQYENGKYHYIYVEDSVRVEKTHSVFPASGTHTLKTNSCDYIAAQTMIENQVIFNFTRTSPDMNLNVIQMKDNTIYDILKMNFKTSDTIQHTFSDFGKDYNKIIAVPYYTGSDESQYSYSFVTNAPKLIVTPHPFIEKLFIFIEAHSVDTVSVTSERATQTLNTEQFRPGLFRALFDPEEHGYYEIYAHGTDLNGNVGDIRKIINTTLIFKQPFELFADHEGDQ